jgi:serine/threonine-protein kinase HipA
VSFPAKIGFGNSPTIIKISPKAFPLLVENEAFFLDVAKRAGIEVNEWRLVQDRTGRNGLVVKRFDRVAAKRRVKMVHQEDGCQLLERYPWQKYRVKMSELAKAVQDRCTSPQRETMRLLALYAFSYLIGNADMHAKNVSLLKNPENGVVELTPGYDLLSTLPYSGLDTRMAISLDGRDDKFRARNLLEFGERWDVRADALAPRLDAVFSAVEDCLGRLGDIGFKGQQLAKLELSIGHRLKQFG